MKNLFFPTVLALFFGLFGCDKPQSSPHISRDEAEKRLQQVKDVTYKLHFNLNADSESYTGVVEIGFTALSKNQPLRVDFYDGEIKKLQVNGSDQSYQYNRHYINVPMKSFKEGRNQLVIEFANTFRREGHGISRFQDPEDKNIYIHTQLEPYHANRVFPSFDQPDLKATYEMEVVAPSTWTVVTATREEKIENQDKFRLWKFPPSQKMSTYVWSLHAGPFKIWEKRFRIPLRLMARQSLAKYIKTEEWFDPTVKGFDFYEKYFRYPYPYKKYDQLIMPEFSSGAMENVAAVTFNERFISRGVKSIRDKRRLANVILHEMSHMWFGDLVTMKWWNDLWLNESFATYMADLALASNTQYKESWRDFYGEKNGAYWEDDLVTTHPIEAEVPNTLQAMANFDGITYGKGAAVLKQLSFFLTPEKFQKGLQLYFKKYAGQNTRREDFMNALSEGAGRDLKDWQESWLKTAGVNRVEVKINCANNKIQSLVLFQSASKDQPYLRSHRMLVALVNKDGEVFKTQPVEISGENTEVNQLVGEKCPAIIYPNYDDHAYLRVDLDKTSLQNFISSPLTVKDALLRQMLWKSIWDLTREAQFDLKDDIKIVLTKGLSQEKDDFILRDLLRVVYGWGESSASVLFYLNRGDKALFEKTARDIEEVLWTRLLKAPAGSEEQKVFLIGFINSARTNFSHEKLLSLLNGNQKLPSLPIDQDKRWDIIQALIHSNYADGEKLAAAEGKKDKSAFGEDEALASKVATSNWEEKKKWIGEFKKEKVTMSTHQLWAVTDNMFPWTQENLREKYAKEYFDDLTYINRSKDSQIAETFVYLAPIDCGSGKDRIGPYLQSHSDLNPKLLKVLKIMRQENQRCQKIVDKMGKVSVVN